MNKIEEIIDKHDATTYYGCLSRGNWNENIILMMKEYAEYYAQKCLEIASDRATTYSDVGGYTFVDSESILNINLPSHD